jgi:hypothetical protein
MRNSDLAEYTRLYVFQMGPFSSARLAPSGNAHMRHKHSHERQSSPPDLTFFLFQWLFRAQASYSDSQSFFTNGKTPRMGDQPVARPLPEHRTTQTQNKRTQISMPWVGFEPTIPASEREKTVHALDRAATVTGRFEIRASELQSRCAKYLSCEIL